MTDDRKKLEGDPEADTEYVDLQEEPAPALSAGPALEHTSDMLYILREANVLSDLNEALEANGVDLIEEA